jgi:hypothetical protein
LARRLYYQTIIKTAMMKKMTKMGTLAAIALMFMLSGCVYYGHDGRQGDVYLEIQPSPHFYVEYFWDDNPSVPDAFYWGHNYPCAPGTYEYEYALSDEYLYWGEYTLIPMNGEIGGYGYDGVPGLDRYYSLFLFSGGGEIDFHTRSTDVDAPRKDGIPYDVLKEETYQFDGFQMVVTRNRMLAKDATLKPNAKVGMTP